MGYSKIRKYGSNCHVFTFNPKELRFDATIGIPGKLEKLSRITGEPNPNEVVAAKINGGFFNMNGSKEYIGTFVDEGNYYNPAQYMYPTFICWKEDNLCTIENDNIDNSRLAYYQGNARFAIGVPWTLVIDGKINYTYPLSTLQKMFGHANYKAPRTLVGQKKDRTIVWVCVDGRRTTSPGYTAAQSAQLMLDLGCYVAVNLDGGGSTEMIVDGKIKNNPSDGAERSIGTALICYRTISVDPLVDGPISNGSNAITTTALNVRNGPGTNYSVLLTLAKGSTVKINGYINGWYNITWKNYTGYCSGDYLTKTVFVPETPDPTPTTSKGRVNASIGLNVRSAPSPLSSKVGALNNNTDVIIYEEKNGWYRIGVDRWVSAQYVVKY